MMFKSFYIHAHVGSKKLPKHSKPRGFTLRVDHDPKNERHCLVRGSWCSAEDHFSRKTGRTTADVAEIKSINKRDLPVLLSAMHSKIAADNKPTDRDYYYVLKYVV